MLSLCLCLAVGISQAGSEVAEPSVEYLPPQEVDPEAGVKVADDGYRYKTVKKLKYRHRRDVSQEYLPPVQEPSNEYLPPPSPAPSSSAVDTKVAEDGYRYKTVKKLKYRARHRRDVSEVAAPSNEYLPPVEVELAPDLKTIVGDDGYRYKTVRRLKYRRHRRDVDEASADAVPAKSYLPPVEAEAVPEPAPAPAADEAAQVKTAELADDGYRYKTVRRIRYRYRH